jgi:tetratricopeptide (TPR) repeat protein
MQLEGFAYRLVPIKEDEAESQHETRVATDIMYDNFMNKFKWGGMDKKGIFLDNVFLSSCALNTRQRAGMLASALVEEGKKDKAIKVLDRCMEVAPLSNVPIDAALYSITLAYYQAGAIDKANALSRKLFDNYENDIRYYYSLPRKDIGAYGTELKQAQGLLEQFISFAAYFKQDSLGTEYRARFMRLAQEYGLKVEPRERE